jgi:hypothetical protein
MAKTAAAKPAASRGRPSKYKDEFPEQARKLCLLGATDKDLARFFGVQESTLNEWKKVHPEFSESLKAGKELADAVIAESLFHRAKGYSHPEVHVSNYQGAITITPLVKHHPPDPTSMIFWLKNRRPDLWRDKPDPAADEAPVLPVKVVVQVEDASQPEAE